MNIRLESTILRKGEKPIQSESLKLVKVRGCNRNEDCVYVNENDCIVYSITEDDAFDKNIFVKDVCLFSKDRISTEQAAAIYELIETEHSSIIAEEAKPVTHYTDKGEDQIALQVLRDAPRCGLEEFKRRAIDFALNNDYNRADLLSAIRMYASQ